MDYKFKAESTILTGVPHISLEGSNETFKLRVVCVCVSTDSSMGGSRNPQITRQPNRDVSVKRGARANSTKECHDS